jgi:hypothetical protein
MSHFAIEICNYCTHGQPTRLSGYDIPARLQALTTMPVYHDQPLCHPLYPNMRDHQLLLDGLAPMQGPTQPAQASDSCEEAYTRYPLTGVDLAPKGCLLNVEKKIGPVVSGGLQRVSGHAKIQVVPSLMPRANIIVRNDSYQLLREHTSEMRRGYK